MDHDTRSVLTTTWVCRSKKICIEIELIIDLCTKNFTDGVSTENTYLGYGEFFSYNSHHYTAISGRLIFYYWLVHVLVNVYFDWIFFSYGTKKFNVNSISIILIIREHLENLTEKTPYWRLPNINSRVSNFNSVSNNEGNFDPLTVGVTYIALLGTKWQERLIEKYWVN